MAHLAPAFNVVLPYIVRGDFDSGGDYLHRQLDPRIDIYIFVHLRIDIYIFVHRERYLHHYVATRSRQRSDDAVGTIQLRPDMLIEKTVPSDRRRLPGRPFQFLANKDVSHDGKKKEQKEQKPTKRLQKQQV